MDEIRGILIFGLNGSGKTTLGRELARIMGFKHMDIEDYVFLPSEIPYTHSRPHGDTESLMIADIEKYRSFIISAVATNFSDKITSMLTLAIHLNTPVDIRMKRIEQREFEKFGDRVLEGGDMYDSSKKFRAFAASRSVSVIEEWGQTLECPVVCADGCRDYRDVAVEVARLYFEVVGVDMPHINS